MNQINMELKEVIQQILPHYETALIEMPKEGHYEWLEERFMVDGICFFTYKTMCVDIYLDVSYALGYSGHIAGAWCFRSNNYQENLEQIQNRVDWMREYLSKN